MNLQQLQYFKTVAEVGVVTKAAEILHISQPALSMALAGLEEELGIPLFEKKGRNLKITTYGDIFLRHISIAIREIDLAKKEIDHLAAAQGNMLHISATSSLSDTLVPAVTRGFAKEHPEAVFHLKQGANMELLESVSRAETDFVFGWVAPEGRRYPQLAFLPICTEEIMVLLHRDHPFASRRELSVEDIREEPFITFHESTGFPLIIELILGDFAFHPKSRYQVYDNATCAALISRNEGIALGVPSPHYNTDAIRKIRLRTPRGPATANIYLIWNKSAEAGQRPLYSRFLSYVEMFYSAKS